MRKKTERKLFPFTEKPLYDENKEKRTKKKDPNVGVCNKLSKILIMLILLYQENTLKEYYEIPHYDSVH